MLSHAGHLDSFDLSSNGRTPADIYTLSLHDALPISPATTESPQLAEQLGPAPTHLSIRSEPSSSARSEEHTSELQSLRHLVCRLLLEKKNEDHIERRHLKDRRHDDLQRAQTGRQHRP